MRQVAAFVAADLNLVSDEHPLLEEKKDASFQLVHLVFVVTSKYVRLSPFLCGEPIY